MQTYPSINIEEVIRRLVGTGSESDSNANQEKDKAHQPLLTPVSSRPSSPLCSAYLSKHQIADPPVCEKQEHADNSESISHNCVTMFTKKRTKRVSATPVRSGLFSILSCSVYLEAEH
ncbi:protein nlrc3 [Moniliophthora roreri]|nr:protein nlrc3 [Moniliophthora roreri]